jgi:DNA replication protein DnaC
VIEQMMRAETTDRTTRSVGHQMSAAKFPAHRDLAGFDFEVSPVDCKLVMQLAETNFTEAAHNVVLVGGPGSGKSHLATAIGVSAITQHGKRVRFYSTVDLVNALEQEKARGLAGRIAANMLRLDVVILDELLALQPGRRSAAVPPAEQAVRAHQRGDHDQPGLRRMVDGVR